MSKNKRTREEVDELLAPPGFVPFTSFTLKRVERNGEPEPDPGGFEAGSKAFDIEKLWKSLKQRPWILHEQIDNSQKFDREHFDKNISVENSLPRGVLRGCSTCNDCQKVTARWRPEEPCRLQIGSAPVFHPTEEEFENTLQYIAKIRPEAEEYGICTIVPPDSWRPHCRFLETKVWESSRFRTHVQQIDKLQNLYSRRKLKMVTEKMNRNRRTSMMELDYVSDGFEFESGPEFTLQRFNTYADHFERQYFQKEDILTDFEIPPWENIEGEYWRIVQNPTEEIQVLSGRSLDMKVLGSGFPSLSDSLGVDQTAYIKSGWNLNNTPTLPGSLLAFESCDGSAVSTPCVDIGMCFSSICWKVEEHSLYSLSYLHQGAPRILYGVPSKYDIKCESALKKTFPELSGHPELFHKLVIQHSPSILKSEGIPVYRCVQYPRQFVVIFPGAYYSGFSSGFNVSESANLAPLDWLPHGHQSVEIYRELHRKTLISYDKLLLEGAKDTLKESWKIACGTGGLFTRALKSRISLERVRRECLCNALQSQPMEKNFYLMKRECVICYYDLYLSATTCLCSSETYTCLEHSKQLCSCPWSSRTFLFRYTIDELDLLIEALEGKLNENPHLFANVRGDE